MSLRPTHRSFADLSEEIYRENSAKFPETKCFSSGPNSGCQGRISFHWTKEALIYNIPHPSPHPSHPCKHPKKQYNALPDLPIAASLFLLENNIKKKNPAKKNTVWAPV
jgi:hypothetical protein